MGGQGLKYGVLSWGHYWEPRAEMGDLSCVRALFGARDRNVRSFHGVIVGGQGPKRGVHSWEYSFHSCMLLSKSSSCVLLSKSSCDMESIHVGRGRLLLNNSNLHHFSSFISKANFIITVGLKYSTV